MIRKIIEIDREKCNGCGACAAACQEGAIGMVDGKAALLRDDYCDGLGNCLPHCPTNAITFVEREAAAYDEQAVMENKQRKMRKEGMTLPCGCPGSQSRNNQRQGAPAVETPIAENEYVKELLALLKENQSPAGKELLEAIGHVSEMEKQLASAVDELKAMRQDLEKMKNSPLKSALQKSIVVLQDRILALRDSLAELKAGIIEGCKNTLAAVKERGISALDHAARFFHIKPGLTAMRNNINEGIQADEKAISSIEAVSAEYHEAGRHVKNIGRALMGKEAVQEAKAPGKVAKTVQAPYRAERACFLAARNSLDKAVASLERLERAAERQPSILKTMQEHKTANPPKKEKTAPTAAHDGR